MRANGIDVTSRKSDDNPMAVLSDDLSAVKRDLGSAVRHGGEVVSRQASHVMNEASEGAKTLMNRARKEAEYAQECVGEFASQRPFTTIALAMLGGALLVGLMSRSSRH